MGSETLRLFDVPETSPDLTTYDWIVINSSAGKDSLAMLSLVCDLATAAGVLNRVVVVHADLGRVEWEGTRELAEKQSAHFGVRFTAVWRKQGDLLEYADYRGKWPSPKQRWCTSKMKADPIRRVFTELADESHTAPRDGDLLEQVEERGMWPDAKRRYCTSDQKRAQVSRVLTDLTKQAGGRKRKPARLLNCMGMRGDESPARAKKLAFAINTTATNGKREVTDWLPLHRWSERDVWARIDSDGLRAAGLVHPCYALGMPRCSCVFCIFAGRDAMIIAGHHNRKLMYEYAEVEKRIGHTFRQNLPMAEIVRAVEAGEIPATANDWSM